MKYGRIITAVTDTAWAITEEKLTAIVEFLQIKADGGSIDLDAMAAFEPPPLKANLHNPAEDQNKKKNKKVTVIPIHGVLSHRMNMMSAFSGGASTEEIGHVFAKAISDGADIIVLNLDTPGGNVVGVQELANQIFAARDQVRIVAVANAMAASAGYWIGSQAHEFSVMPSGSVGSIGVLAIHKSMFESDKEARKHVTIMKAGKFKGEGDPFRPLSTEAQNAIQTQIDERYDIFVEAVARGRGVTEATIRDGFGEGRIVQATEAKRLGMVDRVETLDETLARITVLETVSLVGTETVTSGSIQAVERSHKPIKFETFTSNRIQITATADSTHMKEKNMTVEFDRSKMSTEQAKELDRLLAVDEARVSDIDDKGKKIPEEIIAGLPQEVQDRLTAQDAAIADGAAKATAAENIATVERDRRLAREASDEAHMLFPNLPGTVVEKGAMLQAIRTLDDSESEGIITRLKSGDAALRTLMMEQGSGTEGFGSAFEEIESKAKALMADNPKLTKPKAITQVSRDNKDLYARFTEEKRVQS